MTKVDPFKKIDSIVEQLDLLLKEVGDSLERATQGAEKMNVALNKLTVLNTESYERAI